FDKDEPFSKNKDYEESIRKIKESDKNNIINNYESFCDLSKVTPNVNYAFSSKAFKEYFNENLDTNEIISVFYKKDIDSTNKNSFYYGNGKYLKPEGIDKISFLNKYVFVVFKELVRIMNDFLKDYVYNGNCIIDSIVIESTTNKKNNLLAKKENEKIDLLNKHLSKIYGKNDNFSSEFDIWFKEKRFPSYLDTHINRQRYYLWKEQGGKDFYNLNTNGELRTISEDEIFDCEIDHIIPRYYECLNEFPQNYILTKSRINNDKSNTLPFNYLGSRFEDHLRLWKGIFDIKDKKEKRFWLIQKLNYLQASNIDELGIKFLKRNLTLTSYSIKIIKTYLQNWIQNKIENKEKFKGLWIDKIKDTKIYTVNGFVTQGFRQQISEQLEWSSKDRDNAEEHSIDAFICSILGSDPKLKYLLEKITNFEFYKLKKDSKEIQNIKRVNFKRYDLSEYINSFANNTSWVYTTRNTNKLNDCNLEEKMERLFNSDKYFN
ncbi:MAG: hypothetical protein K2L64_03165, partial [Ureaplasma sp.]|nr:hypothetical protein [Ureaplasma sp.]